MKIFKSIIAFGIIGVLCIPLFAKAQEPTISINSRIDKAQPVIIIRSKHDFEQNISLKMKTNPALSASDVLIRAISKYGMVDAKGIEITSGFDVDAANNLVVAFSGGTSEIIKTSRLQGGFQVIGSFKDRSGNFVSPPINSLAVYNTGGEKLCFEYEAKQAAMPKSAFALLLDRSGSMGINLEAVKQTAEDFLKNLPKNSECAVASFDTSFHYAHKKYQACGGGGFGIKEISVGGGTDIYTPLKDAYQTLSQQYFSMHQKAVIIITDGYTVSDEARKLELLNLKGNILTFVYFIGGNKKDDLEEITDHFIAQGGNVAQSLSKYFGTIGQAYSTQKVLNVRTCQGGSHATP